MGRFGAPADAATAELPGRPDRRTEQNSVVTFGAGVDLGSAGADARSRPRLPPAERCAGVRGSLSGPVRGGRFRFCATAGVGGKDPVTASPEIERNAAEHRRPRRRCFLRE